MAFIPLVEPWIGPACAAAVGEQVASGFLGPGSATDMFASRLAELTGTQHCAPTTSGTIALLVAAKALDLNPGDEIIVPAYGVISTINAFASFGYVPRLVDIDPATACIDPAALAARLTARTKAVCFVNFSGHTGAPLVEVAAFCRAKGLPLIEDAACALGHRHAGKPAGSFGTVGCFSFSVPKIVTTGQGGAVVTDDKAVADRARAFIDHGDLEWRSTNLNRGIGTNLRFNDVLASLGLAQLDTLAERLVRKRRSYLALREELDGYLYTVPGNEAPLHYIVFTDDPIALVGKVRAQEIGATIQYRFLAGHPPYAKLGDGDFLGTRAWGRTAVYLPFGLAMSEDDARRIGRAVKSSGIPVKRWPGYRAAIAAGCSPCNDCSASRRVAEMAELQKLHVGCGKRFIPGFVHIDQADFPHIDYNQDIRRLTDFADGSASLIYACQCITYFDRDEVMEVLGDWRRVLAPGGILRLSVPDFAVLARLYMAGFKLDWFLGTLYGRWPGGKDGYIYERTTYDEASMREVLQKLGFEDIRRWDWRETEHAHVDDFSQAYFPHMDKERGMLFNLNMQGRK